MKTAFLIIIYVLSTSVAGYADWTYDEIHSAIKHHVSTEDIAKLENRHKGEIISGKGYVFSVTNSNSINGYVVNISDSLDKSKSETVLRGDVAVTIPAASPYAKKVKDLKTGQKVSFSGRLDYIFGQTICIRGSAKVLLEQ